ncbi:alkaline phosphatase family protein [Marinovum sp.]|uniref:alkaline phosphatase family protein n=1 Tax=Marinovum sp. TaxID=2024839 RepID=UPI002B270F57|nr:alkaline phosphatase family protein [Marinovum sp.]
MNVLWIMVDQLRWDYLSCYGAVHIDTPNLDWLAAQGMRFNKAYVQSPICGPSRMSYYTGRYVRSHGSTLNGTPLRVGEPTLGEHLRDVGVKYSLVGKTHMAADLAGMKRLGIDPDSRIGTLVRECGFEVVLRDDGENPTAHPGRRGEDYEAYLRSHGMEGDNLWEEWANTGITPDGELVSGWVLENAAYPARVPKEHSETAWLTTRGIDYIKAQGDQPWLCHLSYIKPHWPYMAPAPYNDMYGADDLPPVNRSPSEKSTDHPLLRDWLKMRVCRHFSRDEIRDKVAPVYMGLIKELDDQLGRLFDFLRESGRMDDTMIVFCSDHGDNMGDHWMGEKDLFYDCSARVPLLVYDPRPAADATRGTASDALVEAIDLAPTFVEFFGGAAKPHILEGRSLCPILHGETPDWRGFCVSEYDYATRPPRRANDIDQADARMVMIFDGRWKYVHVEKMRPLLYDLEADPNELNELGADPQYSDQIARMQAMHFDWSRRHHTRLTRDCDAIEKATDRGAPPGVLIGYATKDEVERDGRIFPAHVTR